MTPLEPWVVEANLSSPQKIEANLKSIAEHGQLVGEQSG